MYSSRLVERIRVGLEEMNLETGFLCLVSRKENSECSSQVQRFIRSSESLLIKNREKAASTIWNHYQTYKKRHSKKKSQLFLLEKLKNSNASKIQRAFRAFQALKAKNLLKLYESLSKIREAAASHIQNHYKLFKSRQKQKIFNLSLNLSKIRVFSATFIQKIFKGHRTRKDLFFIHHKFPSLITWQGAEEVSMIGSFTYPAWKVDIPLVYCKTLDLSYSLFFAENKLPPGRYLLRFKSGGSVVLSPDLPRFKSSSGEVFNVVLLMTDKNSQISRIIGEEGLKSSEKSRIFNETLENNRKNLSSLPFSKTSKMKIRKKLDFNSLLEDNSNNSLRVSFSAHLSAKPSHRRMPNHSEVNSSLFIDKGRKCLGISSFEEDWADPSSPDSRFSFEILEKFHEEMKKSSLSLPALSHVNSYLETLLTSAYNKVPSSGCSSVLFAMVAYNQLCTLSLGNSQLAVLRIKEKNGLQVVFKTRKSEVNFNSFELLGKDLGKGKDVKRNDRNKFFLQPVRSRAERFEVKGGDFIVAGNSGIFDNLFDEDLARVIDMEKGDLAQGIALKAMRNAWDSQVKSPFYYSAKAHGVKALGGRLNDFAVVVGCVRL